jgi:hypothetical protein
MKFMITFSYRRDGLTFEQSFKNAQSLVKAFAKWRPDEDFKVHAFLASVSGDGGFVLAEAEDVKTIYAFVMKYASWTSCRVEPVLDVSESVPIGQASLAWAIASTAD